jgi:hypothetical protein
MTILTIIVIIIGIIAFFINSDLNKEVDRRANDKDRKPLYNNELTINTTQMSYPYNDDVLDQNFTFKANYKDTLDTARIYDNGEIDLYKRMPNIKSRIGVNGKGKQMKEDSFIMDGKRYDITFIRDADVKISILTLEYNLITYYK